MLGLDFCRMKTIRQCRQWRTLAVLCVAASLWMGAGCAIRSERDRDTAQADSLKRVAVLGFRPALSPGDSPGVVRDPFGGALFQAEPVPTRVARKMTQVLMDRLAQQPRPQWIPPGQVRGVISSFMGRDSGLGMDTLHLVRAVGKTLGADAVLVGEIYRWRERAGTDYAVDRPASVAFDLHLVDTLDGRVLWRGKYDKTQRSLSENVLDISTFFRGGGKWMRAEELALLGLGRVLSRMPGVER